MTVHQSLDMKVIISKLIDSYINIRAFSKKRCIADIEYENILHQEKCIEQTTKAAHVCSYMYSHTCTGTHKKHRGVAYSV